MVIPPYIELAGVAAGNVISGVAGAMLDRFIRSKRKDRTVKAVWEFLTDPTHVVLPLSSQGNAGSLASGYGNSMALATVLSLPPRLFGKTGHVKIHSSHTPPEERFTENIVILGGGKHNEVYREFVDKLQIPFHSFDTATEESKVIRNSSSTTSFAPSYNADGTVASDIGLFVKARNPYNRDKSVVIIAGSHMFGTFAAADFATMEGKLKPHRKSMSAAFEVVIECKVVGIKPVDFEVKALQALS